MGDNRQPVCFISDPEEADLAVLQRTIASIFKTELRKGEYILVQTKSEERTGQWVDLEEEERVVHKSVLKAKICQVCSIQIYQLESWFTWLYLKQVSQGCPCTKFIIDNIGSQWSSCEVCWFPFIDELNCTHEKKSWAPKACWASMNKLVISFMYSWLVVCFRRKLFK